jgi:N-acetylneuraminic acid mutarotase
MKKIYSLILFISVSCFSFAQTGSWLQKANFGGNSRREATGFSIGTKGYICCGYDGITFNLRSDVWEYDPGTDTWTQKANVGGGGRSGAVGFSIGTKGYVGTGRGTAGLKQDFWEYDQSLNTWIQKANYPSGNREFAVGISIGTKGYVGTGNTGVIGDQYWWEYDPATNTWTQKNNLGWPYWGFPKTGAIAFTVGNKGYVGLGYNGSNNTTDLHEYDPSTNTWTQKANCPGTPITQSVSFTIGTKGYYATGWTTTNSTEVWEYNPSTDTWLQKASFIGTARATAAGFAIGGSGYVGTGTDGSPPYMKDFYEFNPTGFTGMDETSTNFSVSVYPNPFSSSTTLQTDNPLHNATLTVYNLYGQTVKEIKNISGQTIIFHRDNLPSALYFVRLTQDGKTFSADKLVITDN